MKISRALFPLVAVVSLARAQRIFHIVRTICIVESDPNGGTEVEASIQIMPDGFGCNTDAAAETDNVADWPAVLSFPDDNPFGYGPLDFHHDSGSYFAYHQGQSQGTGPLIATCPPESADKFCPIILGSCDITSHFRCVAPP